MIFSGNIFYDLCNIIMLLRDEECDIKVRIVCVIGQYAVSYSISIMLDVIDIRMCTG